MLHLTIKEAVEGRYGDALAAAAELSQDALLLSLKNGVVIELRFAAADEYAIAWRYGDAELRIDTAPLHRELASFPNHLHDAAGELRADPLTKPGAEPWDNLCAVLDALLVDPLLQATPATVG
ncbi:MAG TPA: hypothetical protein VI279_02755 [Rhodocyclaceae bacterium]